MTAAVHNLAILLAVLAVAMLVTALTGLAMGESGPGQQFLAAALATGFVAGSVFLASQRPVGRRTTAARYLFVALAWLVPPLFAAIPLVSVTEMAFSSSLLEAVSGLTTTGATVFDEVGRLSRTVTLWRSELHWLGGLLTLFLILTVLAPSGVGGIPRRRASAAQRGLSGDGAKQSVLIRDLVIGYVVVTFLLVIGLAAAGIPAFDSFCLAMSAISTGGFLPIDGGLAAYANPAMEILLAIAMLVGATSVLWHRMVLTGRWQAAREHRESYWVIGAAIAVGLAFMTAMAGSGGESAVSSLRHGLVSGVSLVSTTGMDVSGDGFSALPVPLILLVAIIGGGAFSTAGGIRFFRIGGMFVESMKETRRLIYPHGVSTRLFGAHEFDVGVMKAIWSLFAASIIVIAVGAAGVALAGVDFGGAVAAAVSAFSNVGGVYGSGWVEATNWPSLGDMPAPVQLLLAALMIVGRLEIVAVAVVVSLFVWRS